MALFLPAIGRIITGTSYPMNARKLLTLLLVSSVLVPQSALAANQTDRYRGYIPDAEDLTFATPVPANPAETYVTPTEEQLSNREYTEEQMRALSENVTFDSNGVPESIQLAVSYDTGATYSLTPGKEITVPVLITNNASTAASNVFPGLRLLAEVGGSQTNFQFALAVGGFQDIPANSITSHRLTLKLPEKLPTGTYRLVASAYTSSGVVISSKQITSLQVLNTDGIAPFIGPAGRALTIGEEVFTQEEGPTLAAGEIPTARFVIENPAGAEAQYTLRTTIYRRAIFPGSSSLRVVEGTDVYTVPANGRLPVSLALPTDLSPESYLAQVDMVPVNGASAPAIGTTYFRYVLPGASGQILNVSGEQLGYAYGLLRQYRVRAEVVGPADASTLTNAYATIKISAGDKLLAERRVSFEKLAAATARIEEDVNLFSARPQEQLTALVQLYTEDGTLLQSQEASLLVGGGVAPVAAAVLAVLLLILVVLVAVMSRRNLMSRTYAGPALILLGAAFGITANFSVAKAETHSFENFCTEGRDYNRCGANVDDPALITAALNITDTGIHPAEQGGGGPKRGPEATWTYTIEEGTGVILSGDPNPPVPEVGCDWDVYYLESVEPVYGTTECCNTQYLRARTYTMKAVDIREETFGFTVTGDWSSNRCNNSTRLVRVDAVAAPGGNDQRALSCYSGGYDPNAGLNCEGPNYNYFDAADNACQQDRAITASAGTSITVDFKGLAGIRVGTIMNLSDQNGANQLNCVTCNAVGVTGLGYGLCTDTRITVDIPRVTFSYDRPKACPRTDGAIGTCEIGRIGDECDPSCCGETCGTETVSDVVQEANSYRYAGQGVTTSGWIPYGQLPVCTQPLPSPTPTPSESTSPSESPSPSTSPSDGGGNSLSQATQGNTLVTQATNTGSTLVIQPYIDPTQSIYVTFTNPTTATIRVTSPSDPTDPTNPCSTFTCGSDPTGPTGPTNPSPSPSGSSTPTPSPSGSGTPTPSPSGSSSSSPSPSPSPSGSTSPSPSPSGSIGPSPSPSGSIGPSPSPSGSIIPSPSPSGSIIPSPSPSPSGDTTASCVTNCAIVNSTGTNPTRGPLTGKTLNYGLGSRRF